MTWFKVDDDFYKCKKVRRLGRNRAAACGVWLLAGNWAADTTSDGFVPWEIVEQWDPRRHSARRLIEVGLWEEASVDSENGIQFHDWNQYQPTRASKQAERDRWRERKATQRHRKRNVPPDVPVGHIGDIEGTGGGTSEGVLPGVTEMSGYPVPSRSSGSFGGVNSPSPEDQKIPPKKCPQHEKDPHPPPCGACAEARRAAEAVERQLAEAQAAARADMARRFAAARSDPRQRCEHGTEAGSWRRADGTPQCALCRAKPRSDVHQEAS